LTAEVIEHALHHLGNQDFVFHDEDPERRNPLGQVPFPVWQRGALAAALPAVPAFRSRPHCVFVLVSWLEKVGLLNAFPAVLA
jgi:hypothetical protein